MHTIDDVIRYDYLKTPLGGLIAVAAMVDDVASLVILAVITEIGQQDDTTDTTATEWAWLVFKPLLISLGVIAVRDDSGTAPYCTILYDVTRNSPGVIAVRDDSCSHAGALYY